MKRKGLIPKFLASIFLGLLLFLGSGSSGWVRAQGLLSDDKPAQDSIRRAIEHLYNFQFDKANFAIAKYRKTYASHPGMLLYFSLLQFWKNYPISAKPQEYGLYKKNLEMVILRAGALEKKFPKSPEPIFFNMMANLILARHHSEEGEYLKAVNETRKAYSLIKLGFNLKNQYPEFYFSTGLYNYYRVAFPEQHPFYHSFTVFFPEGNKALGLKDLETASQKSAYSRAESLVFLFSIHLRDEFNLPAALKFGQQLNELYPENWLFSMYVAEAMLESGKKELAVPIINRLIIRSENAALLGGYYLKGLLEVKENNPDGAKWALQKALLYGKSKDRMTKGYIGLAYNELAKLAKAEGKSDWAKKYFQLAKENCSYKKVRDDLKAAGF